MNYELIETIDIKGETLVIKDSMIMLGENENSTEWPYIKADSGLYNIEAIFDDEEGIYSIVRVTQDGITDFTRGNKIGDVDVDHGSIGIIDYDIFIQEVNKDYDAYEEWTSMDLDDKVWFSLHGKVNFNNATLTFIKAGDGDGSYPVYELQKDGKVIGLECDFELDI